MLLQFKNYTPEVYYKQSRDFQLLGRLFDTVVNHVKTNTDMVYTIPDGQYAGSGMIDLLVLTLGFKPKHNYNIEQLRAVCSILPTILRIKGTKTALELTCRAILRAEGLTQTYSVEYAYDKNKQIIPGVIELVIPQLQNITLLYDLLDYILPAGVSCNIIELSNYKNVTYNTAFTLEQQVRVLPTGHQQGQITQQSTDVFSNDELSDLILGGSIYLAGTTQNGPSKMLHVPGDMTRSLDFDPDPPDQSDSASANQVITPEEPEEPSANTTNEQE